MAKTQNASWGHKRQHGRDSTEKATRKETKRNVPVRPRRCEVLRALCYCNKHEWERFQAAVDTHHLRLRVIHYRQQVVFSFLFFASPETNRISRPDLFFPFKSKRLL